MITLVTGSGGFVGCNMCIYLLKKSHTVIATYRSSVPLRLQYICKQYPNKIYMVKGDMLDDTLYTKLKEYPIDSVIHSAVVTSPDTSQLKALSFIVNTNILSTTKLIEYCILQNIKNFVYLSSASVYGAAHPYGTIIPEAGELDLYSTYAITKRTCELITAKFGELAECKAISARIGVPYGPYERITNSRVTMSPLYGMVKSAIRGEEARLHNKEATRDWTYVEDTVAGLYLLLTTDRKQLRHTEYNVASGVNYSLEEVAETVAGICPKFRYRFVEKAEDATIRLIPDFGRGRLGIERIQADARFVPEFDLRTGIQKYYEHECMYPAG